MTKKFKRMGYGLISVVSLASIFTVGTTAQAKTTEKPLTAIPKVLRGYWYQGGDGYSEIIHITKKHEVFQQFEKKNKKQSFLKYNQKKKSKVILSTKVRVNKTFTLSPDGHNNWFDRSISNTKRDGKTYWLEYYYLRGSKKHPKLFHPISGGIGAFPAIDRSMKPAKNGDSSYAFTKTSKKYLKSIGFYK